MTLNIESRGKTFWQRAAELQFVLVVCVGLVFCNDGQAQDNKHGQISLNRDAGLASKNVGAALDFLTQMGAKEHRLKIEVLVKDGRLRWDSTLDENAENGDTDPQGRITLSAAKVGMQGIQSDFSSRSDFTKIMELALTLIHELLHVEKHSITEEGKNARSCSNQNGYVLGITPHEIEAWTFAIRHAVGWLRIQTQIVVKTEGWDNRVAAQKLLFNMASALRTYLNNYKDAKYYGDSKKNIAIFTGLASDLDAMASDLKIDEITANEFDQRKRCYSLCKSHLLAMLDADNRKRAALDTIAELTVKAEALQNRRDKVQSRITSAEEDIATAERQQGRLTGDNARQRLSIANNKAAAIAKRSDAQRDLDEIPSSRAIFGQITAESLNVQQAEADHQSANIKWQNCMKKCLAELAIDYSMDQLPPGFGLKNGVITYDTKYQPNLSQLEFHSALWHEALETWDDKLPFASYGSVDDCPSVELTGITVAVADVFGLEGLRIIPAPGVKIKVFDPAGRMIASTITRNEIAADFIPLQVGKYKLRLDIGQYMPALPAQCTSGYVRDIELKDGEHLKFTASLYSSNVSADGKSVGNVIGDHCIKQQ